MSQILHPKELEELLDKEEIKKFYKLQKLLRGLNKTRNLTRLIHGNDYWISQVYDSIWPFYENSQKIFDNKKFIDIGSGCGFPGIAYAITHPNSEVYLIDSSRKKTASLKEIIDEINIGNKIVIINDRIENFAHTSFFRHYFDIGVTRAVSNGSTVAEYILPMLNKKGIGMLYCGKWKQIEQCKLENALLILKGSITKIKGVNLPRDKGERNVIYIKPKENCPELYPRAIGKAAKYPLGD